MKQILGIQSLITLESLKMRCVFAECFQAAFPPHTATGLEGREQTFLLTPPPHLPLDPHHIVVTSGPSTMCVVKDVKGLSSLVPMDVAGCWK